jgi:2-dehydro-3-deoxyphosphogluconate aldolase/(4S)-4-hydroxy-2-oxoglutarate aldolase
MSSLERLQPAPVIAVVRGASADTAVDVSRAVIKGGVRGIEITFTTPRAGRAIRLLHDEYGDEIVLGAGTVTTPHQAAEAAACGAEFLVSPGLDLELVSAMQATGLAVLPGALTPSEVMAVASAGLSVCKLFPGSLGGPRYLESLRAPFPAMQFMPTGGVSPQNLDAWLAAGAFAAGVGASLAPPQLDDPDHRAAVTQRAREFARVL